VGIGLVPDYSVIGIWGAVLLTFFRVLQGIGVGGEWGGAVLMAVIAWQATLYAFVSAARGEATNMLKIPKQPFELVTAFCAALFAIGLFVTPGGAFGLIFTAGGGALLIFVGIASLSTTVAS